MTYLLKNRFVANLRWKSEAFGESRRPRSCKTVVLISWYFRIAENPRSHSSERTAKPNRARNYCSKSCDGTDNSVRVTPSARKSAAAALLDYFHGTRGLPFLDAENMSINAPHFLENILKKINLDEDIKHSVTRFLRYHPVNEFEPFLESSGLKPSEYLHLLPRDKMFLDQDALLLENHKVLCNYGISRKQIGRVYKEVTELFGYGDGVLRSKIRAYEELGFSKPFLSKAIACCPNLLIGDINKDFVEVLETLRDMGIEISLVKENLSEAASYNWCMMKQVIRFFREMGFCDDQLCGLVKRHPTLIFENSGELAVTLVGFQAKLGSSANEIFLMFQQFPQIQLGKFFKNLRTCFLFLNEIEMEADEIGKIIRSNLLWLGTCKLKKTSSLLKRLNTGKKRLCQIVQENPQEMKKWALGSKLECLIEDEEEERRSQILKTKFLIDLGYAENTKELDKAHKIFPVKGSEIQERFDLLVNRGLNKNDVKEMVKSCPPMICQSKEVLKAKIDYLENELGYSVSELVSFPSYVNYTIERVKLRFSMYFWLRDKGKVGTELALSTILACSDTKFFKKYVNRHHDGPEVWADLKRQICSD